MYPFIKQLSFVSLILCAACNITATSQNESSAQRFHAQTNCGLEQVQVRTNNPQDSCLVCEGIKRALDFFLAHGFDFSSVPINIEVLDEVMLDIFDTDGKKIGEDRIYAQYDSRNGLISLSSWFTEYAKKRTAFGEYPMSREQHTSVVTHEVTHRLLDMRVNALKIEIDKPTHEFTAYVVQISTMQEEERAKVLNLWPECEFETESQMNGLIWLFVPHKFGVMSYRYYSKNPDCLDQILNGKFHFGNDLIYF